MQDEINLAPIGDAEAVVDGLFGLIYLYPSDYFIVFGSLSSMDRVLWLCFDHPLQLLVFYYPFFGCFCAAALVRHPSFLAF